MNNVSDCCGAPAVEGTLNTFNDYGTVTGTHIVVTYGTCSECHEHSLFSEENNGRQDFHTVCKQQRQICRVL